MDYSNSGSTPVYVKDDLFLYFLNDVPHHFSGWTVSGSLDSVGSVANLQKTSCVEQTNSGWEFVNNNAWEEDTTVTLQCEEVANCCPTVELTTSDGTASSVFPDLMGEYEQTGMAEGRPVYTMAKNGATLHYLNDIPHLWDGWVVTLKGDSLSHDGDTLCPMELGNGWDVASANGWQQDTTLTVNCKF